MPLDCSTANTLSKQQSRFPQVKQYAKRKPFLDFICAADEVVQFTIMTLIHRASPPKPDTIQPFTDECIEYARAALMHHNRLDTSKPPFLFNYMVW